MGQTETDARAVKIAVAWRIAATSKTRRRGQIWAHAGKARFKSTFKDQLTYDEETFDVDAVDLQISHRYPTAQPDTELFPRRH